jgi:ATP-dependent exoDNAse (exonuclease V) beta subunit
VASEQENYRWAEATHPIIARLAVLRADSALRSPLEIVARVLNDVGTRGIVTAWGSDAVKAAQRQRNLDAFLGLAVAYENHCESQYEAATLTGLMFWLENPSSPELDLQPVITSGDAVHVLTYHRSKGLEWPVVIATDFESDERINVWGVRVELTGNFDVEQPLANRAVRYWPNMFGRRSKNLPLRDRILGCEEALISARGAASEARRLAYVGMTRARDLLAIAHPAKFSQSAWLHTFATGFTIPQAQAQALTLPNGEVVGAAARVLDGGGAAAAPHVFAPRWFVQRQRRDDLLREAFSPSLARAVDGAAMGEVITLGDRLIIRGDDITAIGSALHAVIAAELVNPDRADAVAQAEALLVAHGVDAYIRAADAVDVAKRFRDKVLTRFAPLAVYAEYPVMHAMANGVVARGWVDVLIETAAGWVIIDHKSSPRPKSEWSKEVAEYSGQLAAYRGAVAASGKPVVGCWIHFPISAGVVEVVLHRGALGQLAGPTK